MYVLARRLGGPWAGISASLLLACDYLYLLQSQTIDAEVPSVALMVVAVAAASYAERYPWQAAFVSGAATALATLEKLFAVAAIAAILACFVGYLISFERAQSPLQKQEQPGKVFTHLRLPQRQTIIRALKLMSAYLVGLGLAGLLIILPYVNELQTAYQQIIAFHLAASQSYANTLSQNPQTLLNAGTEYPLAMLGLLGIIVGLMRQRWIVLAPAIWIVAALVILLRQAPLFPRHLILLAPGLALSAAIGLLPAWATISAGAPERSGDQQRLRLTWRALERNLLPGLPILLLVGVLAFDLLSAVRFPVGMEAQEMQPPSINIARIEQVAGDLQQLTRPQQQIITDDQYIAALANRDVPPELVDTSAVRIATGYLTAQQVIACAEQPQVGAILFYTGRLDKLPSVRFWVEQHYHLARSYGNGQDLYLRATPKSPPEV
jgi:hypothetical protein